MPRLSRNERTGQLAPHRSGPAPPGQPPDQPPGPSAVTSSPGPTLSLRGVVKSFGANRVLHDIALDLPPGSVTVLMGANGAGKSTLVRILSGVHARDGGDIRLHGKAFAPSSPAAATAAGVVTVHQSIDEGVVPDLDVASNLLLDELASGRSGFWTRRDSLHARAREIAGRVGLDAEPSTPVRELALAERQLVAIARAMAREPQVLILDEPTSSLSAAEAERLFSLLERLRERGVAILYISHRMSDIRRLADRIVAMRDGRISGTFTERPLDTSKAVDAMLGRVVDEAAIEARAGEEPRLELDGVALRPGARPFDLTLRRGEIVAVTGLVGSGKSALADVLFGLAPPAAGTLRLDGERYAPRGPREAIERGVFLCPRDRSSNAVVPDLDLAANISLPFLRSHSRFGRLDRRGERASAARLIGQLGIVCRSSGDAMGTLSGGNQQKAMVARWLARPGRALLLDEPFQGVDIQARRDIGARLRADAAGRTTVVFVSEIDEALEIADRIVVLAEHSVVGDHRNRDIDLDRLLAEMASGPLGTVRPSAGTTDVSSDPENRS